MKGSPTGEKNLQTREDWREEREKMEALGKALPVARHWTRGGDEATQPP